MRRFVTLPIDLLGRAGWGALRGDALALALAFLLYTRPGFLGFFTRRQLDIPRISADLGVPVTGEKSTSSAIRALIAAELLAVDAETGLSLLTDKAGLEFPDGLAIRDTRRARVLRELSDVPQDSPLLALFCAKWGGWLNLPDHVGLSATMPHHAPSPETCLGSLLTGLPAPATLKECLTPESSPLFSGKDKEKKHVNTFWDGGSGGKPFIPISMPHDAPSCPIVGENPTKTGRKMLSEGAQVPEGAQLRIDGTAEFDEQEWLRVREREVYRAMDDGRRVLYRLTGKRFSKAADVDPRHSPRVWREVATDEGLARLKIAARNLSLSSHHAGLGETGTQYLEIQYVLKNIEGHLQRCPAPDAEAFERAMGDMVAKATREKGERELAARRRAQGDSKSRSEL